MRVQAHTFTLFSRHGHQRLNITTDNWERGNSERSEEAIRPAGVASNFRLVCIAAGAQAPKPAPPEMERRIDAIMAKLTLDDKLLMLGGEDTFYTHTVPAAGLPRFKMSDGPMGVRSFGPAPAYAAGVSLAAS